MLLSEPYWNIFFLFFKISAVSDDEIIKHFREVLAPYVIKTQLSSGLNSISPNELVIVSNQEMQGNCILPPPYKRKGMAINVDLKRLKESECLVSLTVW